MNIILSLPKAIPHTEIQISGSKSESNRLLILQKLFPEIEISNISDAQDTQLLKDALASDSKIIDIHHAGTAMRFLTAFFAAQQGKEVTLTGSQRMKERPIQILVDALLELGAEISYLEKDGFPPIKISGKKITKNKVSINSNVSSQYISGLLLIAPTLKNGLEITLEGTKTSFPYLKMTLGLLKELGVQYVMKENTIHVKPLKKLSGNKLFTVESDWSSASYFYSIVALSPKGTSLSLSTFNNESKQGDSLLSEVYKNFGIKTNWFENSILISKKEDVKPINLVLDLKDTPDIAQTIAVTCFGLGISCKLVGLHTLKIKETDRLEALKTELQKLGAVCKTSNDSFTLVESPSVQTVNPTKNISISTYNDHRMAMAFAPLAVLFPIAIENATVVEKSYPAFWKDLQTLGFQLNLLKETNYN
ncbi:MAG: 3-phosphoshikimate 1-carboxyvinyltransferase [Flavobacteriaceae bacterium]|nr:3-phosphoshikimate 1-carboxyvinyltransferase [Flavobacteriaceae bacterium]